MFQIETSMVIINSETGKIVPVSEHQWEAIKYIVMGAWQRKEKVGAIKAIRQIGRDQFGLGDAKHLMEAAADFQKLPINDWGNWRE